MWAVSSQGMQNHLEQSLLTGWLASYWTCQPHFQFHQANSGGTLERG